MALADNLLAGWLFEEDDIRKVEAGCMELNYGMVWLAKKPGMQIEGLTKEHFMWEGDVLDKMNYGKFAP